MIESHMEDAVEVLQQTELFSQCSEGNLYATASHMSECKIQFRDMRKPLRVDSHYMMHTRIHTGRVKYRKGECIVSQGHPHSAMVVISSGQVRIDLLIRDEMCMI